MKIFKTDGLDILSWCIEPEGGALSQAKNIASLPFAHKHVALMPDTHQGFGMPIGGVLALDGVIIPNAVGVDIGCGVAAVRTSLEGISRDDLKAVLGAIRQAVPVGFNHRKSPLEIEDAPKNALIVQREHSSARKQLGTLGGGNHFIEFNKGSDNAIWFMVHSGSRNLGKQVCEHYNRQAKKIMNEGNGYKSPKEWDLAHLNVSSDVGKQYIEEMRYCLRFAKANRARMVQDISEILQDVTGGKVLEKFDIHHNYADIERHYDKDVWVHRKGATAANLGQIGIIPGSQGTKSYIVTGLGNPLSFNSCSHGAGRKMGRKQAERTLNLQHEIDILERQGILHGIRGARDLDEATSVYKDIEVVMQEQADLVDIKVELTPLGVIKG